MVNDKDASNIALIKELTLPEQPKQGEDDSLSIRIYADRTAEYDWDLPPHSMFLNEMRYVGHLKIVRNGCLIEDVKIYDYNYLSLCHRLNILCYQTLNEWGLGELKRIINVSVFSKRVQVIRDILKKINDEIIEVYYKQYVQQHYEKSTIDFPVTAKTLLWDNNKIAKSLYLSGFKYTLIIRSFIDHNIKLIKTSGILFVDKGNGTRCIVSEFSNIDNKVEIKGNLFFDSIGSLTDIAMYEFIKNKYPDNPLYKFVYDTIQNYKDKNPGDGSGAVIHIRPIRFELRHTLRDFIFTDIVEPSLELTEPTKISNSETEMITKDIFIDNLADRLSKLPNYQQYYLIIVDNILSKCKSYL